MTQCHWACIFIRTKARGQVPGTERKLLLVPGFGSAESEQSCGFCAAMVCWFQKASAQIMLCGHWRVGLLVKSGPDFLTALAKLTARAKLTALANTEVAVHE